MRKPKVDFLVVTQLVTQKHPISGTRISKALKTRWRRWVRHKERRDNIAEAITYVVDSMTRHHIGGIVVIRQIVDGRLVPGFAKIFQAKWGHDGAPFIRFDGPGGHYWWGQLRQSYPLLIKDLDRLEKKGERIRAKQVRGN